jgi:hypothetical protein
MKHTRPSRLVFAGSVAITVVTLLSGLASCSQPARGASVAPRSHFVAKVSDVSSKPLLLTTSHTSVLARENFTLVAIRRNPSLGRRITFERRKAGVSRRSSWVGVGKCRISHGGRCTKTLSLASYGEFRYRAASAATRSSDAFISNSVFVRVTRPVPTPTPTPSTSPTPTVTPTPTATATPQLYTDTFPGRDGNIDGEVSPSGAKYFVRNPIGTGLSVVDHRLVRTSPAVYGPGAPTLMWPFGRDSLSVGAQFTFTAGSTAQQNVVVGTCPIGFGSGSVQLSVSPTNWTLFYTYLRTSTSTAIVPLAQGAFANPLATNGSVVYRISMAVNIASSSTQITYPGGSQIVSNPAIAEYWGTLVGFQIRRPSSTDGSAQIVTIFADAEPSM